MSIIDRYITIESLAYKPIALENVPTHRTEGFCFILPLLPVGNPNLASYFPFQTLGFEMPLPSHISCEVHKYIFCWVFASLLTVIHWVAELTKNGNTWVWTFVGMNIVFFEYTLYLSCDIANIVLLRSCLADKWHSVYKNHFFQYKL